MPQRFAHWTPKLNLYQTVSRISKADDRSLAASRGALVAEVGFDFVTRDGLHPPAFQVVIAAVEHGSRLGKLIEVAFDHILDKFVGGLASTLYGEVLEFLFGLGSEVDFHGFQGMKKRVLEQGKMVLSRASGRGDRQLPRQARAEALAIAVTYAV
jgi:hypothetical protein